MAQRIFDLIISASSLILLFPIFGLIGILIKLDSNGPFFFKQIRVGLNGKCFNIYKFRTMYYFQNKNSQNLTIGSRDPRITRVGYYLRKYKIDELPQFINVFISQMSLVGPRPEVPKYVNLYTKDERIVLNVKPGITDWASVKYLNENELLKKRKNQKKTYIEKIMKQKIELNKNYIQNYNLRTYFKILMSTMKSILDKSRYKDGASN